MLQNIWGSTCSRDKQSAARWTLQSSAFSKAYKIIFMALFNGEIHITYFLLFFLSFFVSYFLGILNTIPDAIQIVEGPALFSSERGNPCGENTVGLNVSQSGSRLHQQKTFVQFKHKKITISYRYKENKHNELYILLIGANSANPQQTNLKKNKRKKKKK